MPTYHCESLADLARLLGAHQAEREKRIRGAIKKTATAGTTVVKRNVPVAFGELRESVHATGTKIVIDAPHAAPVEVGSRPHWMPLAPLIAWVRLRGAQGLLSRRERGRLPGTTTRAHADGIASQFRAMEKGGALDADAPVQIARAIQRAIAKK